MSFKTRIFTLLLVGLLVLPIFMSPQRTGQVLGINETSQQQDLVFGSIFGTGTSQTHDQHQNINPNPGQIASGVYAIRTADKVDVPTNDTFSGKAIMNANTTVTVASDKFSLGTPVSVQSGDIMLNLVVQGKSVLSPDTILVLDRKTFESLGGDPKVGEIQVTVKTLE